MHELNAWNRRNERVESKLSFDEYIKQIDGGVCAPKGFKASGVHCGIRKNKDKKDLALIVSDKLASAAAIYTANLVKGAPLTVTKKNIAKGYARAVICNSGNANTCNADGILIAESMCGLVEKYAGINKQDVIIASTGVIGQPLDLSVIERGMSALVASLGDNSGDAACAIMTTDTAKKEIAVEFELSGKKCRIGAIAKGSGMIHPNMATLLVFATSDVAITPQMAHQLISRDAADSFNMVSIDGDTSTNDMLCLLANGESGNALIDKENEDFAVLQKAFGYVTKTLCRQIAKDGEGATKLIVSKVEGAASAESAKKIAKCIISSSLVKTAVFGADANWGRVLCAIGYSGVEADIDKIDVSFQSASGEICVCRDGRGVKFDEDQAKKILSDDEIEILTSLNAGSYAAEAWGCDLTCDYVKINGSYRT